MEDPESVSKL